MINSSDSLGQPSMRHSFAVLLCTATSGMLLSLSFPPLDWWPFAWLALVPFGITAYTPGCAEIYIGTFIGGLVFQLGSMDWIRTMHGGSGLGGSRALQWMVQGIVLAALWPLALLALRALVRARPLPMAIALPIVWVSFEFCRRHLWVVVDGTGCPWGQIGLTQTGNVWLTQIADIGGVYAVSGVIVAASGLLVDVVRSISEHRSAAKSVVAYLLSLALVYGYGQWRLSYEPRLGPIISLMPDDTAEDWASYEAIRESQPRPDLLIWTEGCYRPLVDDHSVRELLRYAGEARTSLVMGCTRGDGPTRFNSAAFVDPQRGAVGYYDKIWLVPFSEFHPSGRPALGRPVESRFAHGSHYPIFTVGDWTLALTICYDVCFPDSYLHYMASAPPDFFVIPACEDHDVTMCLPQLLLRFAQFRAIECRRAIVRNAQGGFSGTIDGCGRLVAPVEPRFSAPVSVGAVPIDDRWSLYSRCGDWLPLSSLLCLLTLVTAARLRRVS
jgi:apolipoprotein N-acyltransferase